MAFESEGDGNLGSLLGREVYHAKANDHFDLILSSPYSLLLLVVWPDDRGGGFCIRQVALAFLNEEEQKSGE